MSTLVAGAGLAAIAVWLAFPAGATARSAGRGRSARVHPGAWGGLVGAVVGLAWWLLGGTDLVLGAIAAVLAWGAVRLVLRRRQARAADERAEQVLLVCEAMAAELAGGQPALSALRRAAEDWRELGPVAVAGELDADVPAVLRELAALPGASQLRAVAAAWQVAHRSGSGLADALAQAAVALREERQTRRTVAAELAAARSTARLMALLPVMVLLLGVGVGGDPVGFLLHTAAGLGCLSAGLLLSFLGMVWLERIADAVLGR